MGNWHAGQCHLSVWRVWPKSWLCTVVAPGNWGVTLFCLWEEFLLMLFTRVLQEEKTLPMVSVEALRGKITQLGKFQSQTSLSSNLICPLPARWPLESHITSPRNHYLWRGILKSKQNNSPNPLSTGKVYSKHLIKVISDDVGEDGWGWWWWGDGGGGGVMVVVMGWWWWWGDGGGDGVMVVVMVMGWWWWWWWWGDGGDGVMVVVMVVVMGWWWWWWWWWWGDGDAR